MPSIIPVFIPHVGCPHDCVFCNQKKIAGKTKAPDAAEVRTIIAEGIKKAGGEKPEVAFYGGSFTAIDRSLMLGYLTSAESFLKQGKISGVRLSTRPDCIDEDVLALLKGFGVNTIELGAQSMDEDVLRQSGRGHTAEDVKNASCLIKKHGFSLVLQMMTHLPGTNDEKDLETARKIAELKPDGVRVYPTVVVRDTALETMMNDGRYLAMTPEKAADLGGKILGVFEDAKIPVIRFGLNPTDDLSSGEAICGAYHPALGEMAMSARYLAICEKEIAGAETKGSFLEISVNPKRVSQMSGQKRSNKLFLCEKYGFSKVSIISDEKIPDGKVNIRIYKKS